MDEHSLEAGGIMTLPLCVTPPGVKRHLAELTAIFDAMDRQYDNIAGHYGFHCLGCDDNCCETVFRHHTLIEYLYLKHGLSKMADGEVGRLLRRAREVVAVQEGPGQGIRVMCPLNIEGLCVCYEFRPMICRLHGLPHELRKPGGAVVYSPGCPAFTRRCEDSAYVPFDRSPLYAQLAGLEMALRGAVGFSSRLDMTIAQMVVEILKECHESN